MSYFCLGIQRLGNTAALFADAETYRCRYMLEDELTAGPIELPMNKLRNLPPIMMR
ncbi:Formimidoylglutamase [Geobacillus sp. BCO2]|nr:Formimidoylglutamase [Geobacillus sp. BCO2]